MGMKHRVKWTVLSEDVRRHCLTPLMKGGGLSIPDVARMLNLSKDKVDRIARSAVTRTQPIKGGAAIVFDSTFDRGLPNFEIIRQAYLIVDQLRNMRADGARPDYIVNTIETGRSLLVICRSSVSGSAAAVLHSLDAVLRFSSVLCAWRPKAPKQKLLEIQSAKMLIIKAVEGHRAASREEDRHVASFFLPTDYQNLMFLADEIDEHTSGFHCDDERNPHTEKFAVLRLLEKWGAIGELQEYAWENKSLRGAWNVAELFGSRAHNPVTIQAGDKEATEEALLLCLRIQQPGPGEDLCVPEMENGPRDVPYLREAYERALKRYRADNETKEQSGGVMNEKWPGKMVREIFAVLASITGAGITILAFVSELLAKSVPG